MLASIIPTRVHGIIDYVVGILLIAAPWLFGFAHIRAAMLVPVILGAGTILYSLLTDYELSLARLIPMPAHLGIDLVAGIVLLASPWLFGFSGQITWPHVTVGIMEIMVVLISSRVSSRTSGSDMGTGNMSRPGMA